MEIYFYKKKVVMQYSFTCNKLEDLNTVSKKIIEVLPQHGVIAFYGEMGAGKTTLIKALCKQLGVTDNISSPTFSLVNEYELANGNLIYHFDFYRIKNIEEAFDIGYEDYFESNRLCFVEWPEKIESLLPENCTKILIHVNIEQRIITVN